MPGWHILMTFLQRDMYLLERRNSNLKRDPYGWSALAFKFLKRTVPQGDLSCFVFKHPACTIRSEVSDDSYLPYIIT